MFVSFPLRFLTGLLRSRIRVVSPVGRFAGSFRPESFRPGFMGGSFRPY